MPQVVIFTICLTLQTNLVRAAECDEFVTWVAPAKDAYLKKHLLFPLPPELRELAVRYLPRLWVHPKSWQPIGFEDYLAVSRLIRKNDHEVVADSPELQDLMSMNYEEQCAVYLDADEVKPRSPAPLYIQVFRDENPTNPAENWIYIKYNLVFDWSGLAAEIGWLSRAGALLSGGGEDRWHRLDVHGAAILGFDPHHTLRLLTLAQHNHQQTYLAGLDFPADQKPMLVAAFRSNELYLDDGQSTPARHRVVPFLTDIAYLIDSAQKPFFWAIDVTYGRNSGGKEIELRPNFIEPGHPLADFAGLLGPPCRFIGLYIGRDGPPGYNYYALPAYISLVHFACLGFWREGDQNLIQQLKPLIGNKSDMHATDWNAMVALMRQRLAAALLDNQGKMK
jgi:hypothetical protein